MTKLIQSVDRACTILNLFTIAKPTWSITEVSRVLDVTKTTALNLLNTLENARFVKQDKDSKRYSLDLNLMMIGTAMAASLELNQKGTELTLKLAIETRTYAHLAVWDRDSIVITFEAYPHKRSLSDSLKIGPRFPAYNTGLGKAILAYLDKDNLNEYLNNVTFEAVTPMTITNRHMLLENLRQVRQMGYALSNEEIAVGVASLAAPIFDPSGHVVGAVNINGESDKVLGEKLESHIKSVRNTSRQISRNFGYWPGTL